MSAAIIPSDLTDAARQALARAEAHADPARGATAFAMMVRALCFAEVERGGEEVDIMAMLGALGSSVSPLLLAIRDDTNTVEAHEALIAGAQRIRRDLIEAEAA